MLIDSSITSPRVYFNKQLATIPFIVAMEIYYLGKGFCMFKQLLSSSLISTYSLHSDHRMAGQLLTSSQLNNNHSNSNSNLNACTQGNQTKQSQQQLVVTDGGDTANIKSSSLATPVAVKKQGVSGESCDATGQSSRDILIKKFEKDFR